MNKVVVVVAAVFALAASDAGAYTVTAGDVLIRGVTGASVNVARLEVATKATPPAGLLLGADIDWSFDGPWAATASVRPVFAPGFVDVGIGVGARYRFLQLEAPFIPWASATLTTAVGGPLGYGDVHFNLGARVGGGIDYFVMRDLAVGVEIGTEVSALLTPLPAPEWTTEALVGVTWRW